MSEHTKFSYSFSFSKNTCDNLRYYKKTNGDHQINEVSEKFIISFIEKSTTTLNTLKRGRPHTKKDSKEKYIPFNFSFLQSTIDVIREYKKVSKNSLDAALQNHLNLQLPVRIG